MILDAVRRPYRFLNYTVAPEPDGKMPGGFNFNHRSLNCPISYTYSYPNSPDSIML